MERSHAAASESAHQRGESRRSDSSSPVPDSLIGRGILCPSQLPWQACRFEGCISSWAVYLRCRDGAVDLPCAFSCEPWPVWSVYPGGEHVIIRGHCHSRSLSGGLAVWASSLATVDHLLEPAAARQIA